MKWFNKMKIRTKLLMSFVIVVSLACLTGYIGYNGMKTIKASQDEVAQVRMPSIESLLIMSEAQTAVDAAENALLSRIASKEARKAAYQRFDNAKKRYDDARNIYEALPQTEEEAKVWKEFVKAWDIYWNLHLQGVQLSLNYDADPSDKTYQLYSDYALITIAEPFSNAEKLLNNLVEINKKVAAQSVKDANDHASSSINILVTALLFAVVLALIFGFFIAANIQSIIKSVVKQTKELVDSAVAGKLSVRARPEDTNEEFREIVIGINKTLDAVINPLNVAANYVDRISKGYIPPKITDSYNGDFNEIKNNLNTCIDAINLLIEDAASLTKAAVEGKLATRADAGRHEGDFRKIVEGVNYTLDAVIGPLNVAASYVEKISKGDMPGIIVENYNGDFNAIKNNLNVLINAFNEIITKAKMVAQGDLTVTLTKRSENDELMGALSDMVVRLSEIVSQVMEAAQNVSTSSNQMSSSAVQIAEGANEQSASAEEVSSSIEEMASSIQQNSDNSVATEKIAVASAQGMIDVNNAAQKSLEAIRKISEKIKIINDIAGKTDILAINAAIEAARAGEQGKGFAVVAAEVRKLAEVSQKAAVEINELSASSLKVTEESGSMMMKIIPEIQKTAQLVKEIAASSNEQRMGSDQITKAVNQFTQVTQENAAAAEEMSSSAEELAGQAELLRETISFFNTGRQAKTIQPTKASPKNFRKSTQQPKNIKTGEHNPGINVNLDATEKDDKLFENF